MSERFPWARFLEGIMVGIMLLLLYLFEIHYIQSLATLIEII